MCLRRACILRHGRRYDGDRISAVLVRAGESVYAAGVRSGAGDLRVAFAARGKEVMRDDER